MNQLESFIGLNETDQKKISEIAILNNFCKTELQVYESTDYEKFGLRADNRKLDFKKVQRLVKSFNEHGVLFVPAIVNEKLEIIDGQHRWAALKQKYETEGVRIPFYFIMLPNYQAKQMITINTIGSNWGKPDYIDHYIANDNKNYILYNEFMQNFPWLNASTAEIIFTGKCDGANSKREIIPTSLVSKDDLNEFFRKSINKIDIGRQKIFQDGLLKPNDLNESYEIARELEKLGQYYPSFYNTNFVKAFLQVRKVNGFVYDDLLKQFEKVYLNMRNDKFKIPTDVSHKIGSYRDCLNDIYNFKKHENSWINLRSVKR
jgi:hypothetical protein